MVPIVTGHTRVKVKEAHVLNAPLSHFSKSGSDFDSCAVPLSCCATSPSTLHHTNPPTPNRTLLQRLLQRLDSVKPTSSSLCSSAVSSATLQQRENTSSRLRTSTTTHRTTSSLPRHQKHKPPLPIPQTLPPDLDTCYTHSRIALAVTSILNTPQHNVVHQSHTGEVLVRTRRAQRQRRKGKPPCISTRLCLEQKQMGFRSEVDFDMREQAFEFIVIVFESTRQWQEGAGCEVLLFRVSGLADVAFVHHFDRL